MVLHDVCNVELPWVSRAALPEKDPTKHTVLSGCSIAVDAPWPWPQAKFIGCQEKHMIDAVILLYCCFCVLISDVHIPKDYIESLSMLYIYIHKCVCVYHIMIYIYMYVFTDIDMIYIHTYVQHRDFFLQLSQAYEVMNSSSATCMCQSRPSQWLKVQKEASKIRICRVN